MLVSRRANPAIAAGVASLISAVVAVALDLPALVVLATVLALVSVVLVVSIGTVGRERHRPDADPSLIDAPVSGRPVPGEVAPLAAAAATAGGSSVSAVDLTGGTSPADGTDVVPPDADVAPAVIDPATGLFNQVFFDASLAKRVSAARRSLRPLSVAVADVEAGASTPGAESVPAPPPEVGRIMLDVFREADLLARADDGRYLILLEDTPENGAVWTLERFRRRLATDLPGHTLWVGVSCYPTYGFGAQQLIAQARRALVAAREWQQDRIEVTAESPDD